MAELLKGAPVANAITEELAVKSAFLKESGVVPTLAILRVGERGDDMAYERGAMKRCEKAGIAVKQFLLPADCSREMLFDAIEQINFDTTIHGCLMFRPLPDKDMEEGACRVLAPFKDMDCMTTASVAGVFSGSREGYAPCTAQAVTELLDFYNIDVEGKNAVVIGRSMVIGRPVSMLLQRKNATVTMCHTKTRSMADICRRADIIIAACGRAGTVDSSFVSPGQIIIDVGINVDAQGNMCGDAAFNEVEPLVAAITPVPGGVGSVTTAVLAKHVIEAAEKTLS